MCSKNNLKIKVFMYFFKLFRHKFFVERRLTKRRGYAILFEHPKARRAGATRRSGGIGRRPGLKIPWEKSRAGSTPVSGTNIAG